MWRDTWESDSWRPRHSQPSTTYSKKLCIIEGSKEISPTNSKVTQYA